MAQRLMVTNRVPAAAAVLTASSEDASTPRAWVQDQLRSKAWRSKVGWNIRAAENDDLDFTEGTSGDATASLTAGNYATGALLAAEIETQMDTAATDNTYTVSYSSSTKKFTIARDTGSATIGLEWSTGANAATSVGDDLGFDTAADDTGATSYEGDATAYKTREWLKVDLGSALAVSTGVVINHNLGATGTITLQGNASDAWTSPTVAEALAGDADIRADYFTEQSLRWWRLLIDDVQTNTAGYSEVGVWYAGPYVEPTVCYSIGMVKRYEQLSRVAVAISGAHFRDEGAQRPVWSMRWAELESADQAALQAALFAVPRGKAFFFGFDSTDASDTEYVWLAEGFSEELTTALAYDIPLPVLAGALG